MALAASVFIGLAPTSSPGSPHPGGSFTVVEPALTDTTADTGPAGDSAGDSAGDVVAFANPVFDAGNVRKVGTDNRSCVRTAAGVSYECAWTTSLAGGSLTVDGPILDAGDSTLAVIGGTDRCRGAVGEMRLHARNPQGSVYDFSFTLTGRSARAGD